MLPLRVNVFLPSLSGFKLILKWMFPLLNYNEKLGHNNYIEILNNVFKI